MAATPTDEPMYVNVRSLLLMSGFAERSSTYDTAAAGSSTDFPETPTRSQPLGRTGMLLLSPSSGRGTPGATPLVSPLAGAAAVGAIAAPPGLGALAGSLAGRPLPGMAPPAPPQWPSSPATSSESADMPAQSPPGILAQSHAAGTCKPCLYYSSGLCHKGVTCTFCHQPHDRKQIVGVRPSKRTRACLERRQRRAAQQQQLLSDGATAARGFRG